MANISSITAGGTTYNIKDSSGTYLPLAGGTMTGVITRGTPSGISYIAGPGGSSGLHINKAEGSIWYPMVSTRTAGGGGWAIGNYNDERLQFVYGTKANINSGTNATTIINLPSTTAGTIALVGDNNHTHSYLPLSGGTLTGALTVSSGDVSLSAGLLKVTKNSNTVTIGSQNTSWCHFQNSANIPFYFNKSIHVDGDIYKYNGAKVSYEGHTHTNIVSRGNVTCETTTNKPAVAGLSMSQVYNNGYPTTYGNVITLFGSGSGQLLIGWSGTSGAHAPVYIRSKRDVDSANWSDWAQVYTTANKPTYSDVGAAASSHTHSYLPLSGGTITGTISRAGTSVGWYQGRNNPVVKTSSINGYSSTMSVKTTNGSWDIGAYNASGYYDKLCFTYITDTNYNAGTNTMTYQMTLSGNTWSGNVAGSSGSCTGNAATATALSGGAYCVVASSQPSNSNACIWVQP